MMPVLSVERDFTFEFSCKDEKTTLKVPVTIPPSQSAADLTGRLVNQHNLPCFVEKGNGANFILLLNILIFVVLL